MGNLLQLLLITGGACFVLIGDERESVDADLRDVPVYVVQHPQFEIANCFCVHVVLLLHGQLIMMRVAPGGCQQSQAQWGFAVSLSFQILLFCCNLFAPISRQAWPFIQK